MQIQTIELLLVLLLVLLLLLSKWVTGIGQNVPRATMGGNKCVRNGHELMMRSLPIQILANMVWLPNHPSVTVALCGTLS